MSYAEIQEAFTLKNVLVGKLRLLHLHMRDINSRLPMLDVTEEADKQFRYPVAGLDYGLLDVLVSDLYPIIAGDSELLNSIMGLKTVCSAINGLVEELHGSLSISGKKAIAHYNQKLPLRKRAAQGLVEKILNILRDKYAVQEA